MLSTSVEKISTCSVADDTAVRDLVATAVQTYGGLDCAVNNAGTEATGGDTIWRFLDSQGITAEQLTSMFPIGRMGRPKELVAAVRYLCSDDARYVTGTMLVLDGGYTAQ